MGVIVALARADEAIDVGLADEAQQARDADRGVRAPRDLREAEMVGRAATLRVAVGNAYVGRVPRGRDDLRQAGLPGGARRVAADASFLQTVKVIRLEIVRGRVQLLEERRRASRAHRVAAIQVLDARISRDADALGGAHLDVRAQAAEIGAVAGAEGVSAVRVGVVVRVAELQLGVPLHADGVVLGDGHRRVTARLRAEVGATDLSRREAGQLVPAPVGTAERIGRGRVAGKDSALEGGLVYLAGASHHREPEWQQQAASGKARAPAETRGADHLSMLLMKGASGAPGESSRYLL
jgi:hypothetical protein